MAIDYIWADRKRILGMPLTFTRYRMSEDRLFLSTGFFTTKDDEILLYRVRDISLTITLYQDYGDPRIFASAITAGGSQAMFFKINTLGEETFLAEAEDALNRHRYRGGN